MKQRILIISLVLNLLGLSYGAWRWYKRAWPAPVHAANVHYDTRTSLFAALPMDSSMTIFLGDSHISGGAWNELFPSLHTADRGIGGDGTGGVLARLAPCISARPRAIVLMIGVNDLLGQREVEDIAADHARIMARIRKGTPSTTLLVCSILPINEELMGMKRNDQVNALNKRIREQCAAMSVAFIDVQTRMIDGEGQLDRRYTFDGIHLNGDGYLVWKETLRPFLPN